MRCARCAHSWFEKPVVSIEEKLAQKIPEFEEMIESINSEPQVAKPLSAGANLPVYRKPRASAALKASVFVAACLVAALALFIKMPTLFGFYSSSGVVLADVKMNKISDEKNSFVEISGNITNETDAEMTIPDLQISFLNEANDKVQYKQLSSGGKTIKAKETIPFTSGEMPAKFATVKSVVVDMGMPFELLLRRKP